MSIVIPNYEQMCIVQMICEAMIIILIAFEPIENFYLKKFVKRLLAAFIFEELIIIAQVFVIYMNIQDVSIAALLRIYEIIRIFINLSLCYPASLFIGQNKYKLQRLFVIICCLVIHGSISEHLRFSKDYSGVHLIAFMLIFLFTFYQYIQLRRQRGEDIPRLSSLMVLEFTLIILNGLLIFSFFTGIYLENIFPAFKITIGILQYQKFYMTISIMSYFD